MSHAAEIARDEAWTQMTIEGAASKLLSLSSEGQTPGFESPDPDNIP